MSKRKRFTQATQHHVAMFNGAELALISPLIRTTNFNYDLVSECEDRGFLPTKLVDPLFTVKFLARTILSAQKAHRTYGIPASILISIALHTSAFDADRLTADSKCPIRSPACECCYSPTIHDWFMNAAKFLANSKKHQKALDLLPDCEAYVKTICSVGIKWRADPEDILANIDNYGLAECDLAALLDPGEYRKKLYTPVDDGSGKPKLVNSMLYSIRELRAQTLS